MNFMDRLWYQAMHLHALPVFAVIIVCILLVISTIVILSKENIKTSSKIIISIAVVLSTLIIAILISTSLIKYQINGEGSYKVLNVNNNSEEDSFDIKVDGHILTIKDDKHGLRNGDKIHIKADHMSVNNKLVIDMHYYQPLTYKAI